MTLIDSDPRHDQQPSRARRFDVKRVVSTPLGAGLLAVGAVVAIDAAGTDDGPGVCLFRRCTGGYCPGCGMTRSARHLTQGQLGAAWRDHPWMVILVIQLACAGVAYAVVRWVRARIDWNRVIVPVAVLNVVLLLGIWVARLIDGSIPRFFS